MSDEVNNNNGKQQSNSSNAAQVPNSRQEALVNFYCQKHDGPQLDRKQAKKQIRNLELVQKPSQDDFTSQPAVVHSQKHIQQIQKITSKTLISPRGLTSPMHSNQTLQIGGQHSSQNTSGVTMNQNPVKPFQFFMPQRADHLTSNISEAFSRNQSLPFVNKNSVSFQPRQSLTGQINKRNTTKQNSKEIHSSQNIIDYEDDKNNIISDNNYFIQSSIKNMKNTSPRQNSNVFSSIRSSINNIQSGFIQGECSAIQNTPQQIRLNIPNNSAVHSSLLGGVGSFSPRKNKEEQSKIQFSQTTGSKFLKQKLNVTQFLNVGSSQLLPASTLLSGNQSQLSFKPFSNNTSQISMLKSDHKTNSVNLNNNTISFSSKSDRKKINISNDHHSNLKKLNQQTISSSKDKNNANKPPNINEFIEREIYLKRQNNNSFKNSSSLQTSQKQSYFDEKLKQLVTSNISPFNPPSTLNESEKEEYERVDSEGFMNYINSVFIDCEYMYKEDIQKQMIQLKNLFEPDSQNNESSNQTLDTPKQQPKQQQNQQSQQKEQQSSSKTYSIGKTSDFQEIEKQVKKLLCVEVAKKKDRKTTELSFAITQMQSFQDILREGIKRCSEQLTMSCKKLVLELVSSLLLLQTKKHMLVEKKKRDDMVMFLNKTKEKEKEFKVNIFGNEQDVEAFRFKLGEIYLENQQLESQLKLLQEKYSSLNKTHFKQRKLSNLIKNEYMSMKSINHNLTERLSQKYESYEKRLSKLNLDQTLLSQLMINQQQTITQLDSSRPMLLSIFPNNKTMNSLENTNINGQEQKLISQHFEQQQNSSPTLIQLPIPTTTQLKQFEEELKSQLFSQTHADLQKSLEDQSKHIEAIGNTGEDEIEEEEDECDIEELLRDVQKITKVEAQDVLIKEVKEHIPVFCYNQECQTDPKITNPKGVSVSQGVQTELQLLDNQFDHIMDNERLVQVSKQEELKEQLMNLSDTTEVENINNISEIHNKSLLNTSEDNGISSNTKQVFQRLKQRISIVRLIKGLPFNKIKKPINKKEIENFTDNIHVLKNFLDSENSQSDESNDENEISEYEDEEEDNSGNQQKQKNKAQEDTNGSCSNLKSHHKKNQKKQKQNKEANNLITIPIPKKQQQQINSLSNIAGKTPNNRLSNFSQEAQFAKQATTEEDQYPSIQSPLVTIESSNKLNIKKARVLEANQLLRDNKKDIKEQILSVIKLYNLETEKSNNYEESIKQLMDIMQELFNFTYKLFHHVQKTQKDSYKSVVEQFYQVFTSLRWRLPKEIDQRLEEDLFPQEALKKKLMMKKKQQQNSKSNAPRLNFNNAKVMQRLTLQDKSVHSGVVLTKKVREIGLPKRFNGYLPLKSILKQITQIYEDRIRQIRESRLASDTDMCIFVFNRFIHQYGFKNVAEQKFLHFLMNILNYQQIFRVNVFAKLIGVFPREEDNYTIEEMDKYISCWNFLIRGSTLGSAIAFNESDLRIYSHYLRALDLLKVKLEKILPPEFINELRAFIEQTKELEAKQTNKLVIDVDQLLTRVLVKYRLSMNSTKVYVRNAFLACDLDGNGSINLNEFLTLYRHIEIEKFSFSKAFKMFESNADILTEDEKCLSFQKFTALCLQNHLFLDEAQRKFIGVRENYEIEMKFFDLKEDWSNEKAVISNYIESLKPFVQAETYEVWRDVLLVLQDRIIKNSKVTKESGPTSTVQSEMRISSKPSSMRNLDSREDLVMKDNNQNDYQFNLLPILIAHKLLKQELKRLIEVGQNEELNDADLNSDSNDDENNEYAIGENINTNSNIDIMQQNDSRSNLQIKKTTYEDDLESIDSPSEFATKKRIQKSEFQQQSQYGSNRIEMADSQIYQFSDIQVMRETPKHPLKKRMKTNQSNNNSFSKSSTFSIQKQ